MTFQYSQATPLLTSMHGGIKSFNGQTVGVGGSGEFPRPFLFPNILSLPHVPAVSSPFFSKAHKSLQ